MFKLNLSDHRPLYEQIKENFEELIIKGVLKENDKIPSVRELAGSLAINPNTIQKAYRELENEGFIYSVRAKGSFVAPYIKAAQKIDNSELLEEFKVLVAKLKFSGLSFEEMSSVLEKEYKNQGKDDKNDWCFKRNC